MTIGKNKGVLAIDIGGSKLLAGIVGLDGSVLHSRITSVHAPVTAGDLSELIIAAADDVCRKCSSTDIVCAGAAVPGVADPAKGTLVYACFSGIRNFEIGKLLYERYNLKAYVANDVNACALGEKEFGACRDVDNFIWVTVSNGIGGAIYLNGSLYTGAYNGAGEIGHINVVEDGFLCSCGNRGCLEAYASGASLARRYHERFGSRGDVRASAKAIAEAARNGDEGALEIYRETGSFLGKAISYAVNIVNPQKIILGGGVSMDLDLFLPEMKNMIAKYKFQEPNQCLRIEKTALSYNASLIGAAAAAMKGMGLR